MTSANQPQKSLFITLLVVLVYAPLFSQFSQSNRFEKEILHHDKDFLVISLSSEGIALVREDNKFKSGKQFWEVTLLDTILHEKKTLELELEVGNELKGYEYTPGFIHLLFSKSETKGEMSLISIDLKNGDLEFFKIKVELFFTLTHFFKVGNTFVFGGYVNMEPSVLLYSTINKSIKIVPGFFLKNTELIDMRANQNQTFNTLLLEKGDKGTRKLTFRIYDAAGKQLFDNEVSLDEDITVQNGISSVLKRDDLIIAGTWGRRNTKQALGFYTLPVSSATEQKINRIYLGQLSHYLDYLKPKKATKVKLKTTKAIELGKFPEFSNYVMPFKIFEYEKGYLVLAEVYRPPSGTVDTRNSGGAPYYNYPYQGSQSNPAGNNPYSNDPTITGEVNTIESVLLAFNPDGSVLWDHSIKVKETKRAQLEQVVDFQFTKDCIQFLYKNESELILKRIELVDEKTTEYSEKIKLPDLLDEIQSESKDEGLVTTWFGKNFYVWGYQSVWNRKASKTRDVLYINKVTVH